MMVFSLFADTWFIRYLLVISNMILISDILQNLKSHWLEALEVENFFKCIVKIMKLYVI